LENIRLFCKPFLFTKTGEIIKDTRFMKKIPFIVCVIFLLLGVQKLSAQYYFYDNNYYDSPIMYEIGGGAGIMNCLTDLGGKRGLGKKGTKDLNLGNDQINGSVYLSATYKNAYALRLEGTFGQVKAYDSILKDVKATTNGRYERNQSFRSKISEISVIAEFHPLFMFKNWEDADQDPPRFSPYLAAGIGFYSFNPQTQLRSGQWVDLQPLHTEGQGFAEYPGRKPYKLHQMNIPIGVGFKYELTSLINIRAEFMYRILSTDYLDDVSTRYVGLYDPNLTYEQQVRKLYSEYFTGTQLENAIEVVTRNNSADPNLAPHVDRVRGNPKNNDAFFTFNLKVGLTFGRERIK
jgi:hypothetical protein